MLGLIIGVSIVGVLAIVALLIAITFRRVVDTNMIHIVQRSDKSIPYGRGQDAGNAYYEWPTSLPKIGVTVAKFKSSIFQIDLNRYGAYDEAKVPFVVDIASFFRIEEPEKAAMRVKSFEELEEQLKNVLQGSVRKVLANNPLEKTMESRGELGKQFTAEVKDQLAEWGVIPVKSIEFMDLQDAEGSQVIQNIMAKEQSRIEKDSRIEIAENEATAKNSEIENQRKVDIETEVAAQQVGERKAEKDKAVGIADEQAKQEVQSQAAVTAEKDMAVIRVQQVKKAEIQKEMAVVKASEEKEVAVVNAEADKQSTVVVAEGQLKQAELNAKGISAEGKAKGEAERAILQAPVDTQISLAQEIGENEGYQNYLISVENIKANQEVGIANAVALEQSDLKVIVNSGDVQGGVGSLGDILSPKGGTAIGGMIEALNQTPQGSALVEKFTGGTNASAKTPNVLNED